MKKLFLFLFMSFILSIGIFTLIGCTPEGGKTKNPHVHTYEGYQTDEQSHWQTCSCGEQTEKKAHTFVWSISENGHFQRCEVCGYEKAQEEHSFEWLVSESGHRKHCKVCGYEEEMLSHTLIWEKDASNHRMRCEICGYEKEQEEHTFEWSVSESGHRKHCKVCGYEEEIISHTLVWEKDATNHRMRCDICGYTGKSEAHDAIWKTDTSNHWMECGICGYVSERCENTNLHWDFDENYHWADCSACGEEIVTKHIYGEDSGCEICGYSRLITFTPSSDGSSYLVSENREEAVRVGEYDLVIPDHFNGKPVTQIKAYGFDGAKIRSVVFPEGLEMIDRYAFRNCSLLTELRIPAAVEFIYENAFSGCSGLKSLTVPFLGRDSEDDKNSFLGYWFGAASGWENSSKVPASLQEVRLTGGSFLADYAFSSCKISDLWLPSSIKTIGNSALNIPIVGYNLHYAGDTAAWCGIRFGETHGRRNLYFQDVAVENLILPDGVTEIPSNAFSWCMNLKSVRMPNSLKSIGDTAFKFCEDLIAVTFSEKLESIGSDAFMYTSVQEVRLPDSLISLGSGAFSNCESMSVLSIGNSLTEINTEAFYCSRALKEVVIPDQVEFIRLSAFAGSGISKLTWGDQLKMIGSSAFSGCVNLEGELVIPDSVQSIHEDAFSGCKKYTGLVIGSGVENIGKTAFYGCTGLQTISVKEGNAFYAGEGNCLVCLETRLLLQGCNQSVIPDGVKEINERAFRNCTEITQLIIPASVIKIGKEAFFNCSGLQSIVVEEGNTVYRSETNCLIERSTEKIILGCNKSVIPNGVTAIGDYAFFGCSGLTEVVFPASLGSVGDHAFYDCSGIQELSIPSTLSYIGSYAFGNCTGLFGVTFEKTQGWVIRATTGKETSVSEELIQTPQKARDRLVSGYVSYCWIRKDS